MPCGLCRLVSPAALIPLREPYRASHAASVLLRELCCARPTA